MKIKTETIIRTIILIVALINQGLTMAGVSLLPITDDQIAEVITLVITIGASLWSWWKNNYIRCKNPKSPHSYCRPPHRSLYTMLGRQACYRKNI